MNQPTSRLRLLTLAVLLVVELALVISLRTSGWIATGNSIRSFMIVLAVSLPFVMTAVLVYRVRASLRRGQWSLRAILGLTLVVASYLALLPLFEKPNEPNFGPLPVSKSVRFEVFQVVATGTPNTSSFTDPETGTALSVAKPPIVTGADVATVQLTTRELKQGYSYLTITLNPAGGNKLFKATSAAKGGKLVFVLDGEVLAVPDIFEPLGAQSRLTGPRIDTEGSDVFKALTDP